MAGRPAGRTRAAKALSGSEGLRCKRVGTDGGLVEGDVLLLKEPPPSSVVNMLRLDDVE